jgi:hypothetical protein
VYVIHIHKIKYMIIFRYILISTLKYNNIFIFDSKNNQHAGLRCVCAASSASASLAQAIPTDLHTTYETTKGAKVVCSAG